MTKPEYVKRCGLLCPVCEQDKVRVTGQIEKSVTTAWQECSCQNCNATWVDVYNLAGYDYLIKGKEREA